MPKKKASSQDAVDAVFDNKPGYSQYYSRIDGKIDSLESQMNLHMNQVALLFESLSRKEQTVMMCKLLSSTRALTERCIGMIHNNFKEVFPNEEETETDRAPG